MYDRRNGSDSIHLHRKLREKEEQMRIQRKKEQAAQGNVVSGNLSVSDPQDANEKEADSIAQKVANGQQAEIPLNSNSAASIQSKGNGESVEATSELSSQLVGSKGGGQSMDDVTRSEMESKMGTDFSDVKIHTDNNAHAMSESVNAKAFAHGQDVYFGKGNYNPQSTQGKELLAHELVHTKQASTGLQGKIQRSDKKYKQYDAAMVQSAAKAIVDADAKVRNTLLFYSPINDLPKGTDKVAELEKFLTGDNTPTLLLKSGMQFQGNTPTVAKEDKTTHKTMEVNHDLTYPVAVSTYLHELNHYMDMWYSTKAAGTQKRERAETGPGVERYFNFSHLSKRKQINALEEQLNYHVELIMTQVTQETEPENPQPQTPALRTEYQDWLKNDYAKWLSNKEKSKSWQKLNSTEQEKQKQEKIDAEKEKIHGKTVKLATKAYSAWGATSNKKGKIKATGVELGYAYEKEAYSFNKAEKENWAKNFNDNFEKQYASIVDWYER